MSHLASPRSHDPSSVRAERPRRSGAAARLCAAASLAIAAGYGLASCGSDPLAFSGASSTTGGGQGEGGDSGRGGAGGAGGAGTHEGCDGCAGDTPVCVDGDHCAAECPDGRDACGTGGPGAAPACCASGEQCCEAAVFGYAGGDVCRPEGEACPIACPGGDAACGVGQFCEIDTQTEAYACRDDCAVSQLCDYNLCCPVGAKCVETGSCPLPDLAIDAERLAASVEVISRYFEPTACEIAEGCIAAPGRRTLLRFSLTTPNVGTGDLELGHPEEGPLFHYSDCHEHFHFDGYADYRLLNASSVEVGQGHKQAFCLLDYERVADDASDESVYTCSFQGIQRGWADTYDRSLPCQWVDVTDVAPGSYSLKVTLNKDRALAEERYDNNEVTIPVEVPANSCVNGCRTDDAVCCQPGDPCGWATDGSCDCADLFGWDAADCASCLGDDDACDLTNTCPAGCAADPGGCCQAGDPCGLGDDGSCDCGGAMDFEANDCSHCTSADPTCPVNTCPNGCSPLNPGDPCCAPGNQCGWANDGWCDCGGADWDAEDCASCLSLDPDCP
jgi:hypothetical protein